MHLGHRCRGTDVSNVAICWSSLELKQTWTWHVFQRCPFLIVKQCPSIWSAKRWEYASRLCFLNYYIFIFVCKGCCTNMWQQHQFSGQPIGASAYHCQSAYIDPTWRILQPPVQMEGPLLETSLSDSFCSLAHHVCDWRLTMKPGMGLKNTLAKAGLATRQSTNFCDANVTLCPTGGGDFGLGSFLSKDCCMDQRISAFFSGWVFMDQNAFAVNDEQQGISWVNLWTCFPFLKLCDFESVEERNIYTYITPWLCWYAFQAFACWVASSCSWRWMSFIFWSSRWFSPHLVELMGGFRSTQKWSAIKQ